MLGGIFAWAKAGYPVYTTYHTVSVNPSPGKPTLQIDPALLISENCSSCQSGQTCSSDVQLNVTRNVLLQSGNRTVTAVTEEFNGTKLEYTTDATMLWSYSEFQGNFNRTVTLTSILATRTNGESTHVLRLYDEVHASDYNLTLLTILTPLDSDTYNNSVTIMNYAPIGKASVESTESGIHCRSTQQELQGKQRRKPHDLCSKI
jgi:hypothetical protein